MNQQSRPRRRERGPPVVPDSSRPTVSGSTILEKKLAGSVNFRLFALDIVMQSQSWGRVWLAALLIACLAQFSRSEERTQRFDRDPGWEGHNNRSTAIPPRSIKQDFGYSNTAHAGGTRGE